MSTSSRRNRHVALVSRRALLVASAVVLGVSACGSAGSDAPAGTGASAAAPSGSSVGADLPRIMLSAGLNGEAEKAMAGDAAMTSPIAVITEYRWVGEADDLTAPATAWRFVGGDAVDDAAVARLAEAFGVEGEVRQLGADRGGGRMVGPDDWSAPAVFVYDDAMGSWSYQNPMPSMAAVACDAPAYDPSSGEPPSTDVVECPEPQPPAGVPSTAEAEQMARELLATLGVDLAATEMEVYGDDWGVSVTAWSSFGGVRSSVATSIGFGGDGAITWASGYFATPEPVADYPRIGVEAAVARLNEQSSGWWGWGPAMARTDDMAVESDVAATTDTLVGDEPAPMPEPLPEPLPEPETVVVDLIAVAPQLEMVWDVDGVVWLLPAYRFTTSEEWNTTVYAIADEYLVEPEYAAVPEPAPLPAPEPGVAPATIDEVAAAVVGLAEAEAVDLATVNGWVLRVARLDGEDLALTADYVTNRYDVEVVDGTVVAVLANG